MLAYAAILAAAVVGCRRDPGPEQLHLAWQHASDRRVDEALPLVKGYLIAHPRDAAAHYVLGKCYLHRQDVNTTLAKGEFETALHCFDTNPDLGVLTPEMTPDQFRSAVHRDIALALMRAIYEGDGQGLPPSVMFPVLDQALDHVRTGLRLDPASSFLREMEQSLTELRRGRPAPEPPPAPQPRPGEITI